MNYSNTIAAQAMTAGAMSAQAMIPTHMQNLDEITTRLDLLTGRATAFVERFVGGGNEQSCPPIRSGHIGRIDQLNSIADHLEGVVSELERIG